MRAYDDISRFNSMLTHEDRTFSNNGVSVLFVSDFNSIISTPMKPDIFLASTIKGILFNHLAFYLSRNLKEVK